MENALFEHTIKFDEETYRAIGQSRPTRRLRAAITLVVGFFMLLWSYTFLLGVLVLIVTFLDLAAPGILPKILRRNFQGHRYLHHPLTYGVSSEHLWVQGETINAKAAWSLLVTWQIKKDWLVLSPSGIPQVYLPVPEMKRAGVYDKILVLAKKNGKEFR